MADSLLIKDYKNWIVSNARTDCEGKELALAVANSDAADPRTDKATIKSNADDSVPGTPIEIGEIVSVVIFPLEPRQE